MNDLLCRRGQIALKTRLKLKRLTAQIDAEVKENFGYDPASNQAFDALISERAELERFAKEMFPEIYVAHEKATYGV